MALQKSTKELNNFVKGLVTEANELTFPENSSKDEVNFDLNRDGSRSRRYGIDYELGYALTATGLTDLTMKTAAVRTTFWDNVANDPDLHIAVVQTYTKLWFFNADVAGTAITATPLNGGAALTVAGIGNNPVQFTAIDGVLICTSKGVDPFYVSYVASTDTMSTTTITLQVRDLWGVDDGLAVDNHPATLSDIHNYNLKNQGWNSTNISTYKAHADSTYPSNADIQHLGKITVDVDAFDATFLKNQFFGTGQAPRGRYIINAFTRGASRLTVSGLTTPTDSEAGRPSTSASYGGRVFYAGIDSVVTSGDANSPSYNGMVFFSRTISSAADFAKCYQEADPTSEHISDIIDTDGGYIVISEASNIMKLVATASSLVVIAENGIWEIYGDTGGFTATAYQVSKVTNVGCVGAETVVNAEGTILYWSKGGIYTLSVDSVSGRLTASNLTENTIQTFYNDLQPAVQANAKGCFDPASRKITWLYNGDENITGTTHTISSYSYRTDRLLVLDTVLKAFSKHTIGTLSTNSPYIVGCLPTHDFGRTSSTMQVVVGDNVVCDTAVEVQLTGETTVRPTASMKFLAMVPSTSDYNFTFANFSNSAFIDWKSADSVGVDAAAYLETGSDLFGETQRKKGVNYLTMHLRRTEDGFNVVGDDIIPTNQSSCRVSARWDFANHSNGGNYGASFQAYKIRRPYQPQSVSDSFDQGQAVISTKNKLRGNGKALSLYIATEPLKDLKLLGWGLEIETSAAV